MFCQEKLSYKPFSQRIWLSSPTMHGEELTYMTRAYSTNWMSTVGENIDEVERLTAERIGCRHSVALSSGTAALHLSVRLAGEKLYGPAQPGVGALAGRRVFCSDLTFAAGVNPVVYEGGMPVFIDAERDTWNMDPAALERAFSLWPEVRLVVAAHLYGVPAKIDEIRAIVRAHGALLVEDAAESFGATRGGRQTGSFGDYGCISFNGNKIITGSAGGMLLTDIGEDALRVRKWATQSREDAPWYQHRELGYNYRMSNVVAGVVRGQLPHLEEHIARKRDIYLRYQRGLDGLPISMNPFDPAGCRPNFWLSCLLIHRDALCAQTRGETASTFVPEPGKSCPAEILETLAYYRAEGRPIWKPMHLQPLYHSAPLVTAAETAREGTGPVSEDLFARGLCLPSDIKMTPEQQDRIIELIRSCFA